MKPETHCKIIAAWWRYLKLRYRISFWLFLHKWGITEYEEDEGSIYGECKFGLFHACDDGIPHDGPIELCKDYSVLLEYSYNSMSSISERLGYSFEWVDNWCGYYGDKYGLDCIAFETDWRDINIDEVIP